MAMAEVDEKEFVTVAALRSVLDDRDKHLVNYINGQLQEIRADLNKQAQLFQSVVEQFATMRVQIQGDIQNIAQELAARAQQQLEQKVANNPTNPMANPILQLLMTRLAGGDSGLDSTIRQIQTLQQIANIMNQPMAMGMKMMADMMATAVRAGVPPEQAANAGQQLVTNLLPSQEQKK